MSIHRRTTGTGEVRYDVRLRKPDGTPYSTTFRTKREAEQFERAEMVARQQGTWIDPQAGKTTLHEWAEEWYSTTVHTWRASTAARHRTALDQHWLPRLGSTQLSAISPRTVQRAVNDMAKDLRPSTIRSYYGTLRNMLGDAVDVDMIGRTPCRGIKLPSSDAMIASRGVVGIW